jgi:ATP-dependent protease ClpP protease subunit
MIDTKTRELFLYTEFGPAWAEMIDAPTVQSWIQSLGSGDINVRINSYGGSVDEALAIIAMLQRHDGAVTVTIDSIAASAASLFGAAFGAKIASHARVMIHNPLMMTYGNANDHEKSIEILKAYTDSIVGIYKTSMGTKYDDEEIQNLLDAETWFNASAAVDAGLATEIVEPKNRVAAKTPKVCNFKNPLPFKPADETPKAEATENDWLYDPARIAATLRLKIQRSK